MSQGAVITDAQIITWIVAGSGIFANLIWNWRNRIHTNSVAEEIRSDQRRLDRWDRLRARIEAALDGLVGDLKSAHLLVAKADKNASAVVAMVDAIGLEINLLQDALATALEDADRADFCDGTDWGTLANGKAIYDGETSWDMINIVLRTAAAEKHGQIATLKRLKLYADDIDRTVRDALEVQDDLLVP
ncbi:hypothetical protein [Qipengyuania sp. DGS5-3]|uniref:hypothetical protein n=1 Tax=Qipengyuania sp. DGS5-3 TaxID=3349632 RepID=UPI0036D2B9A7